MKKRKQASLLYSPYLPRNIQGLVGFRLGFFFFLPVGFFSPLSVLFGFGIFLFVCLSGGFFLKMFQETSSQKKKKIQTPTLWKELFYSELCLSMLTAFHALEGSAPHHCELFRNTASAFIPFSSGADTPAVIL